MSLTQYLALLGLWIAGIVAPGPDILVILRNAFLSSRGRAMLTALGVMLGNVVWITLSLTGVTVVINQNQVLRLVIQVGGALFLAWLGYASLRSAAAARPRPAVPAGGGPSAPAPSASGTRGPTGGTERVPGRGPGEVAPSPTVAAGGRVPGAASPVGGSMLGARGLTGPRAVLQGIVTNLSNAKAIVFFVALFATVVPAHARWWESLLVAGLLFLVGSAWFCAVAWFGSVPALAARFQAHSAAVETAAGAVFVVVAAVLLLEALTAL